MWISKELLAKPNLNNEALRRWKWKQVTRDTGIRKAKAHMKSNVAIQRKDEINDFLSSAAVKGQLLKIWTHQ